MKTHTPGPWDVDAAGVPVVINGAPSETSPNIVALIYTREDPRALARADQYDMETAMANARLIAAAPLLLDALTKLLAEYIAVMENPPSYYPEIVQAQAAIAVATLPEE